MDGLFDATFISTDIQMVKKLDDAEVGSAAHVASGRKTYRSEKHPTSLLYN
jgi:hypothetical protein